LNYRPNLFLKGQPTHLGVCRLPAMALTLALAVTAGCGTVSDHRQVGAASWYGPKHHGKRTASGQPFNQDALTAAHPQLPFGSRVKVTNLANGKEVIVTINDRGPYKHGRIIDLSRAAARALAIDSTARVSVEVLSD
jgi:rare lipoprotein A